jgi:elongation factor P
VEYDKKLNAVLKGYDQMVFDLRALAPPAAQAESYRRLLAAYNYQDLLLHNLLEAGDSGRLTKVKAVLRKLEINGVSLKSRAYDPRSEDLRQGVAARVPSGVVAETVDTNSFKNGMHIELDNKVWRIVEFQHVKPGKGGAFVRTKLKSLEAGAVVDRTFRAGEKFPRVHTETKSVQFLYDDGSDVHFMDAETYEQFALPHADLTDELPYMQPNASVQVLSVNGKPSSLQLPASVELEVVETEPAVKGDTVSNVTKPATLQTGAVVQVPMFVNVGDRLKVDPREGRYISRA